MKIRSSLVLLSSSLAFALVGCSSSSQPGTGLTGADAGDAFLGLETPSDGYIVKNVGTTIPAGKELEFCEVAELPGDANTAIYVKSIEFANGPHSHHLIVSVADPGGPADATLRAMNIGDRVPCLSAQIQFGEVGLPTLGGIQQPYGRTDYPAGVGRKLYGGQRIVFDYHYLNLSAEDVQARSAFALHLEDASEVKHEATSFGFYNWTIDTPAKQTGAFKAECHFKQDVMLGGLTRHTHRWGTDYTVWHSGGADDGQQFWKSTDWEHDVDYPFTPPVLVKKGEGYRFECDYDNTEDHDLRFGTSANDEMCILFGLIWDAGDAKTIPRQDCDIVWIDPATGVGHPADEAGGFPKASDGDAAACLQGSSTNGAALGDCAKCRCTACGDPIVQCAADAECGAILSCLQNASGDAASCQSAVVDHSSGVGLLQRVRSCIDTECAATCGSDPLGVGSASDAGTH